MSCGTTRSATRAAPPPRAAPAFLTEPVIRVAVVTGDTSVELGAEGRWWVREEGSTRPIAVVDGGPAWRVVRLPFERALRVERADGYLSAAHPGPLRADPLGPDELVVNGTAYPGTMEIRLQADGTVTAVNVVGMETYLEGVVAREMGRPSGRVLEALKAQAVAARTYALKRMGSRAELGFDVYGSVQDQAYAGVPEAADSLAVRAVRATRGEAILFQEYLIDAYYHSTCGGQTARVEEAFDAPPAPYLTVVSDARPDGEGYWCQPSRVFRWTESFDRDELEERVARNLPLVVPLPPDGPGQLLDLEVTRVSPEGRALALRVTTTTGSYVMGPYGIRQLFADAEGRMLRSTLFLFRPRHDRGWIVELSLTGGGWGHGVGMCQIGAMERARAGHGYREIVTAYYPGTRVAAVYGVTEPRD
jgi:stage II sporulation protein D